MNRLFRAYATAVGGAMPMSRATCLPKPGGPQSVCHSVFGLVSSGIQLAATSLATSPPISRRASS
jgi:hypothetical protein